MKNTKARIIKKETIVFVGNYWPYVSGGHRIFGIAPVLAKLGHDVHIFTMPLTAPPGLPYENVTLHQVPTPGDVYQPIRKLVSKFRFSSAPAEGPSNQLFMIQSRAGIFSTFISFLFRIFTEIFAFPDADRRWQRNLFCELRGFLKSRDNVVVVSEFPFVSHVVASKLKKEFNFIWLADFVDLW